MKQTRLITSLTILLFSVCQTLHAQLIVCENDSTGLIPLIDLGPGYYEGYQGGLFLDGSNFENPAGQHFKKGKNFAKNLQPLDSLGNINYDGGTVLMGGFGPSLPGHMMDEFVPVVRDTTDDVYFTNICFDAINMGAGGKGLDYAIGEDSNKYWNNMEKKIAEKGYTVSQLQVGWMYFNDKYDSTGTQSFPETPNHIRDNLVTYLHMLKNHFPNMKIMFVSGRHYGGYADSTLEQFPAIGEPASYWNNWSVKWLIEDQITGDPDLKYFGANIKSPFLTWGPYYWTDGAEPRATDGRSYTCEEFSSEDGFHLDEETYVDDADYLMQHVYNSEFSKYYVKDGTKWTDCVPYLDSLRQQTDYVTINPTGITLYPNPASDIVNVYRHNVHGKVYAIEIYNEMGQLIHKEESSGEVWNTIPVDVEFLANGLYVLRVKIEDVWMSERFLKQ